MEASSEIAVCPLTVDAEVEKQHEFIGSPQVTLV